jgi:hypothetical protein
MGRFSREEIENAFEAYQAAALRAGTSGDWTEWANCFTEDATWVEHHYGTFGGRDAIRTKIQEAMSTYPGNAMPHFPIEWYIVDEERAWIVCHVWNRLADPGDGSVHQAYNFTLLKYAGHGLFSYEEDIYNPADFANAIVGWEQRKAELAQGQSARG